MAKRKEPYTTEASVRPQRIPGKGFYRDPKQQPQEIEDETEALADSVKRRSAKIKRRRGRR
jgi:hypothetical protein